MKNIKLDKELVKKGLLVIGAVGAGIIGTLLVKDEQPIIEYSVNDDEDESEEQELFMEED